MQKLLAKKLNKKGFTLAELLIVVAIIAVLVAIAIPIFTGALEKARLGVHRSNARNLKSMAVATILADPSFESHADNKAWTVVGYYDFVSEKFTISSVSGKTAVFDSPKMYAYSSSDVASGGYEFGVCDSDIGTLKTNGTTWYRVEINAQDLSGTIKWES